MRDFKINAIEESGVDIDMIDGEAAYLDESAQTGDQRAALCVYAVKGSVPGAADYGVSWAEQYTQDNTVAQLSNEVSMQLQQFAAQEGVSTGAEGYNGNVLVHNGAVSVVVMRG